MPSSASPGVPVAEHIAAIGSATHLADLSGAVTAKVGLCLRDLIGCACESFELDWARQARGLAAPQGADGVTIIAAPGATSVGDAAFANAVMGHGLVREDMHSGSISHLGIVVLPTVLALAETQRMSGADFLAAIAVGYEVGGQIGRAVMDADVARIHRPTGVTGPIAAAAAGARLLSLAPAAFTSAVALATNTTLGFNQWAHTGGSEMFFQAGFAARNAVSAVRLAAAGAFASPSALDGEAGLFAALGKPQAGAHVQLFAAQAEILSVYHKAVPVCNFAQTPCLAALELARTHAFNPAEIAAIIVRVPAAGARYPGCDARGPFAHSLQGKMSIQFNVAAALVEGSVSERNFTLLDDARIARLIALTTLEVDADMSAAYPALQGGEVVVSTTGGETHRVRLENVVNATDEAVRERFRAATAGALGSARLEAIEACLSGLAGSDDAGALARLLRADPT